MNIDKYRQCGNCEEFRCTAGLNPWDNACGTFALKSGDIQVIKEPPKEGEQITPYLNEKGKFVPKMLSDEIQNEYDILTFEDTQEAAIYKDGIYTTSKKDVVLKKIIKDKMGDIYNRNKAADALEHIKLSTIIDRSVLNPDPWLITVKNGMYDVQEDKLLEHDPKYLSTLKLNVVYDKDAQCISIHKFLTEVVAPEDIPLLVQYAGYSCTQDISQQKALLLDGRAANGKSTFIDLVCHMIGQDNVAEESLQDLNNNRFSKIQLKGKLLNMFPDLPKTKLYDNSVFKMLTSDTWINGEDKNISAHRFMNTIHQIYSANQLPDVDDPDELAYFRRWISVTFPNSFEGRADKHLKNKLTTDTEISGFFNIAMEGLRHLLKYDLFCFEKTAEEIRAAYLRKSNPVYSFTRDCLEPSVYDALKIDVFDAYEGWCKRNNAPVPFANSFGAEMKRLGYDQHRGYTDSDNNRLGVWLGVSLTFLPSDKAVKAQSGHREHALTLSKEAFDSVYQANFRECQGIKAISTSLLYKKYYCAIYRGVTDKMPCRFDTSESLGDNQVQEPFEKSEDQQEQQLSSEISPDRSQRDIINFIRDSIQDLQVDGKAPITTVLDHVIESGIAFDKCKSAINHMKAEGRIFEPVDGFYKCI